MLKSHCSRRGSSWGSVFWGVCLVLACELPAYASPGTAVESREVREWLMRIHNAASQRNFQGTFVVSSPGVVSSARISHFHEGADQCERIEPLEGQARQVLRHGRGRRSVEHESQRSVIVVLDHEHDGLIEVLVAHVGHRDEQLAGGPAHAASLLSTAASPPGLR